MTLEKILRAFEGVTTTQPLEVNIKFREKRMKILVGLGEIIVCSNISGAEKLGEIYECKIIKNGGRSYRIVPNVVRDIIKRDGVLASCCDEHREKLRKWFKENGVELLRVLLEEFT